MSINPAEPVYGPMPEPVAPEPTDPPTVRETATVTVKRAVDGTKKKRKRGRNSSTAHRPHRTVAPVTTRDVKVDPLVWAAAQRLVLREGEKLKIRDAQTVVTEYLS